MAIKAIAKNRPLYTFIYLFIQICLISFNMRMRRAKVHYLIENRTALPQKYLKSIPSFEKFN